MLVRGKLEYSIIIPRDDWPQLESRGLEGRLGFHEKRPAKLRVRIGVVVGNDDGVSDNICEPFGVVWYRNCLHEITECNIYITPDAYTTQLQRGIVLEGNRYLSGHGRIRIKSDRLRQ